MLWNPIPVSEAVGLTLHVVGEIQFLIRNYISHTTADTHYQHPGPKTALHVLYFEDKLI